MIADIESYNTWIELKRNRDSLIFSIVKGETPDGSTDIEFHADNIVPGAWTDQKILFEEFETEVNNTIADYMHYIETHNTNKDVYKRQEEYAFKAIKGSKKSNAVVLGKYERNSLASYDNIAKNMNAQYFYVEDWGKLAKKYPDSEMWKINERFLDIQTSSGREIYLSHDPKVYINKDSFYSNELKYLLDNGYRFVKKGDIWNAVRK